MEIVKRGAWNFCNLLASSAPLGEVEGICPECWLVVAGSHHFGGKGASSSVEIANPFTKLSHNIVCLLVV